MGRSSHDNGLGEYGSRHTLRVVASCGDLTANSPRDAPARYFAQYAVDLGNAEGIAAPEHAGSVADCMHSVFVVERAVVAVCSDSASAALAVAACLASVVAERAVAYSGFVLVAVAPAVHGCFDSGVAAFLGSVAAERAADLAWFAPSPFAAAWVDLAFRSSVPAVHTREPRSQESTTIQPN